MLTKSATKLLDSGLANLEQEATPGASLSQRPAAENAMTAEGTGLGTLQYMAPEQVEGKTSEIDARTDIFAFGVMVYEMATGKKAFEVKTSASVMTKILEVDSPPMSSLADDTAGVGKPLGIVREGFRQGLLPRMNFRVGRLLGHRQNGERTRQHRAASNASV